MGKKTRTCYLCKRDAKDPKTIMGPNGKQVTVCASHSGVASEKE